MAGLGEVTAALATRRKAYGAAPAEPPAGVAARLVEGRGFDNPGALRMLSYTPQVLARGAPLVVVLHGCTQTAAGYAAGAGWLALAERYGFALLCPEQTAANNPNRCFNWFEPGDTARGAGEAASIRAMIEAMATEHGLDRQRVFVTGLSAGGAMTSVLLATYPEVFAGGAIVAGLPFDAADSMGAAFAAMGGGRARTAAAWAAPVRSASAHRGPWPRVSVWHGGADATVAAANGEEIVKQWTALHGVALADHRTALANGRVHREWLSPAGEVVVEHHALASLGHGTPLAATGGAEAYGEAGPFLLETGVSSSLEILGFWGLTPERERVLSAVVSGQGAATGPGAPFDVGDVVTRALTSAGLGPNGPNARPGGVDVQGIINKALTDAGLMR
jgi:feruloyl esterase